MDDDINDALKYILIKNNAEGAIFINSDNLALDMLKALVLKDKNEDNE